MERNEFDDLVAEAASIAVSVTRFYREVTGEDIDLDSVITRYPLMALGTAAGLGALAGWWIGRKSIPLPPPPPPPASPLDYLERLFPERMERARRLFPEIGSDEMAELARNWIDTVVQPRLKDSVTRSRLAPVWKRIQDLQGRDETHEPDDDGS